jgi:hypothetical protein
MSLFENYSFDYETNTMTINYTDLLKLDVDAVYEKYLKSDCKIFKIKIIMNFLTNYIVPDIVNFQNIPLGIKDLILEQDKSQYWFNISHIINIPAFIKTITIKIPLSYTIKYIEYPINLEELVFSSVIGFRNLSCLEDLLGNLPPNLKYLKLPDSLVNRCYNTSRISLEFPDSLEYLWIPMFDCTVCHYTISNLKKMYLIFNRSYGSCSRNPTYFHGVSRDFIVETQISGVENKEFLVRAGFTTVVEPFYYFSGGIDKYIHGLNNLKYLDL